ACLASSITMRLTTVLWPRACFRNGVFRRNPSEGETMKRMISMLCMAVACSVALAAQSSTSDKIERKAQRKAERKGEVLVTGCVADKDSRGHYLLSNASANN